VLFYQSNIYIFKYSLQVNYKHLLV